MTDRPSRSLEDIVAARIGRRGVLGGMAAAATVGIWGKPGGLAAWAAEDGSLGFEEISAAIADTHRVAKGYTAEVLIRWGDPVMADAPPWTPAALTAAAQSRQFGYNNDFIAYMPLPLGGKDSTHGLLCVNHEYTNGELMFAGMTAKTGSAAATRAQAEVEMAAHGHSVIEVRREGARWRVVANSAYARRLTALATPMRLSGPAAGHDRLKTAADPTGRRVIGTINDCGGGKTPWGTVLLAEENFNNYFQGNPAGTPEAENHARLGVGGDSRYSWGRFFERFDLAKTPTEANRFGWVVEFDPYDPAAQPVKRTALGRFKHEGASCAINPDGSVTVYSGDDERFQYLYRFVTAGRFDSRNRAANRDLLDRGTLSAARFAADGTLRWLPLVWGQGPLTPGNGFAGPADVMIEARRAAELVGATPMDRPEDIETNPVTGRVIVILTNNSARKPDRVDAANPRADNRHGHILELTAPPAAGPSADHAAEVYRWDVFLLGGNPAEPRHGARAHPAVSPNGWVTSPDNCAFDPKGRLWIATDQGSAQRGSGKSDGLYGCDVGGPGRALTRLFFACPRDAEMCGPEFTPDGRTLFVAVQHPGEYKDSSFATPSTRWPDFRPGVPPRPSVVAITRDDGGEIGA